MPAWIQWTYERSNAETARFFYQLCYPPINADGEIIGGWTAEEFWTRDRIFWAEKEARKAARARLGGGHRVIAYSPELPDDAEFFAACESGNDFGGHWYSRDPVGAPDWEPLAAS
ncbi:hypothetical protein [Nocardia cyriacigeorgica]|uniref:hypothetical protein n=1 Tax=Nocardia cyriacigeorgica TaxID=135487 RepID=UPI002457A0C5|nr:hypothetical protein [Nocardia cyriacigeorgica]